MNDRAHQVLSAREIDAAVRSGALQHTTFAMG